RHSVVLSGWGARIAQHPQSCAPLPARPTRPPRIGADMHDPTCAYPLGRSRRPTRAPQTTRARGPVGPRALVLRTRGVHASAVGSGSLDGRDLELEGDLLADQDTTGLQGGVPGDAEVLAVDDDRALEAGALVAERVG